MVCPIANRIDFEGVNVSGTAGKSPNDSAKPRFFSASCSQILQRRIPPGIHGFPSAQLHLAQLWVFELLPFPEAFLLAVLFVPFQDLDIFRMWVITVPFDVLGIFDTCHIWKCPQFGRKTEYPQVLKKPVQITRLSISVWGGT